jgi:hypothetical protein
MRWPFTGHRFAEAFQPRQFLARAVLRHEGALAGHLDDHAFLLQVAQRLAHGDAAHAEDADLAFGGQPGLRGVGAVDDTFAQPFTHLRVQRDGGWFDGA